MKNNFDICGCVTLINLRRKDGKILTTRIDTEDFSIANSINGTWFSFLNKHTNSFYVSTQKNILLHRLIMGDPKGMVVDHIDHNTLNNCRSNLRILTNAENMQNRKGLSRHNRSGFRGVHWNKERRRWIAQLELNGKKIYIGHYDSEIEADAAVREARKNLMPYSQESIS